MKVNRAFKIQTETSVAIFGHNVRAVPEMNESPNWLKTGLKNEFSINGRTRKIMAYWGKHKIWNKNKFACTSKALVILILFPAAIAKPESVGEGEIFDQDTLIMNGGETDMLNNQLNHGINKTTTNHLC